MANILSKITDRIQESKARARSFVESLNPLPRIKNIVSGVRASIANISNLFPDFLRSKPKIEEGETAQLKPRHEEVRRNVDAIMGQEYSDELPDDIKEMFVAADKVHAEKQEAILNDFVGISKELSPGKILKRDAELDKLATESLDALVAEGKFEDHKFAKKMGFAENYTIEYFDTAEQAADFFRTSEKGHWENMNSPYKRIGVALKSVFNKKAGKHQYILVVLYDGGKTLTSDEVPDYKETPIPSGFDSSKKIKAFEAYETALKIHADRAGLDIITKDKETTKKRLKEEEIARGSYIITLRDKEREADYMISKNPPLVLRWKDKTEVPFFGVVDDFRARAETMVDDAEGVSMSAGELEEEFDTPAKEPRPRKKKKLVLFPDHSLDPSDPG